MSARGDDISSDCIEVTDATPSRSRSIDDLRVGMTVVQKFAFGLEQLAQFKQLANDRAPIHSNPDVAQCAGFDAPIIQGLALATRFSRLIGMYLPGERAILERIELKYKVPVFAGQQLIYRCTVARILRPLAVTQLTLAISANGKECVTGQSQCLLR
jgi:acyl dehydratase